jgi:hypothetical protein
MPSMKVNVEDQVIIGGCRRRRPRRRQGLDVLPDNGPFRYLIQWEDNGQQDLLIPDGGDVVVIPTEAQPQGGAYGSGQVLRATARAAYPTTPEEGRSHQSPPLLSPKTSQTAPSSRSGSKGLLGRGPRWGGPSGSRFQQERENRHDLRPPKQPTLRRRGDRSARPFPPRNHRPGA